MRLATLIVDVLEVGTGKRERDVINEIFEVFGVDFNSEVESAFPADLRDRTRKLRHAAAERLAEAAPSEVDLINAVVRCGGRFVSMLKEVYERLYHHTATTVGASETFRLERAGVDETHLKVSPAFIELVSHLERSLQAIDIGQVDEAALRSFIGWDNGESYGRWPLDDYREGFRLVNAVLQLPWVASSVAELARDDDAWVDGVVAVQRALVAAESLVASAERLARAHVAHVNLLRDVPVVTAARDLFSNDLEGHGERIAATEINHLRSKHVLGMTVPPGFVTGIRTMSTVGLANLEPVVAATSDYLALTGAGELAGFVAMWRLNLWPSRERARTESDLLRDPAELMSWLRRVEASCREAESWLSSDVFVPIGTIDVSVLIEAVVEFLNLPLWRQRHLLYEVWVLCVTLHACERADWLVDLSGLVLTNEAYAEVGSSELT